MKNPVILDDSTLKRVPYAFVFILVLLLGLPLVAINYGMDFGIIEKYDDAPLQQAMILKAEIRGYFRQVLLQWSAFSLAAITVLLAFTQYRLTKDYIALIIGLSILFSGSVEALNTLIIDGFSVDLFDKENLEAVIWTFSNIVSGLILLAGLILVLVYKDHYNIRTFTFILLTCLLVTIAVSLIYYAASVTKLPQMWFPGRTITRPYEVSYLCIYALIMLGIYPTLYRENKTILTNSIFYMSLTQIVMALYLMGISSGPYDSGFNVAYFLKIIVYFIPFSSLIISYIFSYRSVLKAQETLKQKQKQLSYIAAHDELTGLYNRREFENLLNKTLYHCQRKQHSFALLFVDIDNFKDINDNLGHAKGDAYLKKFSEKLSNLIRLSDILARIGGDEFAIVIPSISSPIEAEQLAQRILETFSQPYAVDNSLWVTTISIGIAIYPDDSTTRAELLQQGDFAMYKAKQSGKNAYFFYSEAKKAN